MKKQVNERSSDYVVPWLAEQQSSNNLLSSFTDEEPINDGNVWV